MRRNCLQSINTGLVLFLFCFSACLRLILPDAAIAQVRPVNDYGAIGLAQMLKRLNTTASVMMTGAHPDDEDSSLLAYLARGENARTAYLSLTRGDGGQNIIGPELFESLGVIRTEELLQARRLDGAEQYFTRAYDYGFSKTLTEAKQKWDEKVILCDMVRAIRIFRPLVVISRFSGTPADGHGHHQYSGYITPLAVKAAADPRQCVESGEPWQVIKFYVEQGFSDSSQPTLRLNTGAYDPLLGRSYFEISMEGRSQHRTQGQGVLQLKGEQYSGLNLIDSKVPKVEKETSIFDGIGTSVVDIGSMTSNDKEGAAKYAIELQKIVEQLKTISITPSTLLPLLVEGYKLAGTAGRLGSQNPKTQSSFYRMEDEFAQAIELALGMQIDALSDRETVIPGEDFSCAVKVFFPKSEQILVKAITVKTSNGWQVAKSEAPTEIVQGFNRREIANQAEYFSIKVPASERATQPYWLEDPRDGELFRWANDDNQTLPFQPPFVTAEVKIEVNGTEITLERPIQFRYADPSRGEIRRELNLVPALSINVDQKLLIVPLSDKPQTRRLTVSITNNSTKPVTGLAGLNINAANGWNFVSNSSTFALKSKGEKTNVIFDVTIPAKTKPGTYNISAHAIVGESLATQTMTTISYPHIQTHRFYTRAETMVDVLDLKVAPVQVGYVMGSGDDVPEAIRQLGLNVTLLDEKDLASGDLAKFDTVVVGIRASETRPDLVANNQRLLDYVNNGGNLIFQYQRPPFAQRNLLPFPASMADTQRTAAGSTARVVDEDAKVTILKPDDPVFNFPNKIGDDDFKGWVQERNAYNFVTFDERYTPLLESHDAGEAENKGGLVYAQLGKGTWTYCSYSFFRQLPAGVGGAYRLFANLLSLPKATGKRGK